MTASYVDRAREIMDIEIEELRRVRDALDGAFDRAVALILDALGHGGKVVLTGVGKNIPIAQKIAATLTSTGCPAVVLHPSEAMHGDLGILLSNDVVLALSYSGASEELLSLVPVVKRAGVRIVAITGDGEGPLARLADGLIPVRVAREACPFNMAPTASTTATLAVGDALAMVLLEARGFRREDFAKLHPGGAIGRTLLLRVADIMRTGERMAKVRSDAKVRDALVAMTGARSGAVAVVDAAERVVGIFTDGDLRRRISGGGDIAGTPISEAMTPAPIRLGSDRLAVDLLRIFEEHNIEDVVVTDAQGRLAGMVDLQDLPKLKIL
jgi:arabinose-5-phosphate isomerase